MFPKKKGIQTFQSIEYEAIGEVRSGSLIKENVAFKSKNIVVRNPGMKKKGRRLAVVRKKRDGRL